MLGDSYWLTEEQFERLAPLLPSDTRGVARVDNRRVIPQRRCARCQASHPEQSDPKTSPPIRPETSPPIRPHRRQRITFLGLLDHCLDEVSNCPAGRVLILSVRNVGGVTAGERR